MSPLSLSQRPGPLFRGLALTLSTVFLIAMSQAPDKPEPEPETPAITGTCGAENLQHLRGKPLSAAAELPVEARLIRPHTMVTQDWRPERLNIELDENDVIVGLRCG